MRTIFAQDSECTVCRIHIRAVETVETRIFEWALERPQDACVILFPKGPQNEEQPDAVSCNLLLDCRSGEGLLLEADPVGEMRWSYMTGARAILDSRLRDLAETAAEGLALGDKGLVSYDRASRKAGITITADNSAGIQLMKELCRQEGILGFDTHPDGLLLVAREREQAPVATERSLWDFLCTGMGEDVYLGHREHPYDVEYVPVGGMHLDNLSESEALRFQELLRAQVSDVRFLAYGSLVELTNVRLQQLSDFAQVLEQHRHQNAKKLAAEDVVIEDEMEVDDTSIHFYLSYSPALVDRFGVPCDSGVAGIAFRAAYTPATGEMAINALVEYEDDRGGDDLRYSGLKADEKKIILEKLISFYLLQHKALPVPGAEENAQGLEL